MRAAHYRNVSPQRPRDLGLLEPNRTQTLADLHTLVAASELVAVSVETDARHGYKPTLALVSLAVVMADEVTLATLDTVTPRGLARPEPGASARPAMTNDGPFGSERGPLDAIFRALANARLLVHGGEHPLALMRRQLGLRFFRLIDTQQAAVLLGLPRTGLRALVAERLGAELPPARSVDWTRRPLDVEDLLAAQAGVRHLPALWRTLLPEIERHELTDELEVASRLVEDPPVPPLGRIDNLPDPRRFRHIPGAARLSPEGLAVLAALSRWRDQKAKELDLPPLAIFSNAQLVDLATSPEHAQARLSQVRFHSRLVHADQQSLRLAILTAMSEAAEAASAASAPDHPGPHIGPMTGMGAGSASPNGPAGTRPRRDGASRPKKGQPSAATRARLSRLKEFRRVEAERRGVGLLAVLPAVALEHLAFFPDTPLDAVPGLGSSRIARYGAALAALLRAPDSRG